MPKGDLMKHGCFPVSLPHIFRTPFPKKRAEGD